LKKILLFGAGKIGRSFIGQLFSRGGYEVIFVDINRDLIKALNDKRSYNVLIKSDKGDETLVINNIRGILLSDHNAIYKELTEVSYVATAVGNENLKEVIPILAEGFKRRLAKGKNDALDIIIAENLRNASAFFKEHLAKYIPADNIHTYIGLIETSIGKMVPIMTHAEMEKDITQVFAEPYNTLILDKKGFKNELPDIRGLAPKENMAAWVDRKSFIHNLGHATAAYSGFLKYPEQVYMYEVLADEEIRLYTRNTMLQSGNILQELYPGEFSDSDISEHIDDLIFRFRNRSLGDTVFRVGLDLYRKLGREDRLAGVIHQALDLDMPYSNILKALVYGMHFRARDEKGELYPRDQRFSELFAESDIYHILENICGFDPVIHSDVFTLSKNYNIEVLSRLNKN
jgi:mannitol-1-phosphate 5-dehydrogenase